MAAGNASRISKTISKIASPSNGSPKKILLSTPSPKPTILSEIVFKIPTGEPKQQGLKAKKEAKITPCKNRRSIPVSPWNKDHYESIKSPSKKSAVGGVKRQIPTFSNNLTPMPKGKKPVEKTVTKMFTNKSTSINMGEYSKNNTQKMTTPRKSSAMGLTKANQASSSTGKSKGQLRTPKVANPLKPNTASQPVTPSYETTPLAASSVALKPNTASQPATPSYETTPLAAASAALKDKVDILGKQLYSIGYLSRPPPLPVEGVDLKMGTKRNFEENKVITGKHEENTSGNKLINEAEDGAKQTLNESSNFKSNVIKTSNTFELGARRSVQNNLSPFTLFGPTNDTSSPQGHHGSLENISSPRRSHPGDKPWSPYGQALPRVFERQYDNFADAIFSPYITDDENATAMRSPRYSF